ncbi:TPA: hypothetical protein ACYHOP_001190 [Vibrio cholerae]|uniref:hypothetical protein n=1 Tax=Vibrio cholerae TaxID=666 RepID=UPI00159611CF|nr:hypothetical protein [Vibrio cholerae]EJL6680771.1 hypothetical protein [Vibrio cholerae]EKF9851443.1 hypothetical protein [Vibrio cholerae]ELN6893551.1 hypothetical protein [Vibrio cholerae]MCX9452779.1 hypothetical protein [Vibrio cholerae]MCX9500007.1 hypothetical protein [Vibrio cholerae]
MKRFFPSAVMLVPFVVKHYPEQEEYSATDDGVEPDTSSSIAQDHLTDTSKAHKQSMED